MIFGHRIATRADVPAIEELVGAAIDELQRPFLDRRQIEASHAIMGVDRRLIDDGTYFVVEHDGELAGCGGWSRRRTRYGHTGSAGRDDALLDPRTEAARVRAMYTSPRFTRRGVGRIVLRLCERAAAAEGFTRLELVATEAGRPLYLSAGFSPVDALTDRTTGIPIPLTSMRKALVPPVARDHPT